MRFHKFYSQKLLTNAKICQRKRAERGIRTPNYLSTNQVLHQLNYLGNKQLRFTTELLLLTNFNHVKECNLTRKLDSNQRLHGFADRCFRPLSHSELGACLSKPSSVFPLCLLYGQELYCKGSNLFFE